MENTSKPSGQFSELIAIPAYRKLFAARVVSNFGNGMTPIALAFGVLSLPGGNAGSLSLVTTAHMLPLIAFMLIGGVVADRFGRARLVGLTDIIGSLFSGASAFAFLTHHASVPLLCFNGFMFGILNSLWYPAFTGLTPQLVPARLLQSANSLLGTGANLAFTFGSATAGVLVATAGPGWGILIDAVSFFIAGIIVYSMRHFDSEAESSETRTSMFSQLKDGWQEVSSRRWFLIVVSCAAFFHLSFEGFFGVIAPVQAKAALDGARSMGYMMTGWGLGGLAGTLVAFRLRPRRQLLLAVSVMPLLTLWMFGLAIPAPMWLLVFFAFIGGVAIDLMYANWMTTLQTQVPEEAMSRVGAYDAFGSMVFAPVGLFVAGPLTQLVGPRTALIATGSLALVAALTPLLSREVRHLERREVYFGSET
jgi:MFS family permease